MMVLIMAVVDLMLAEEVLHRSVHGAGFNYDGESKIHFRTEVTDGLADVLKFFLFQEFLDRFKIKALVFITAS